jgi:hypothetical protein
MDGLTQIQSVVTFAWWMAFALSVVLYVVALAASARATRPPEPKRAQAYAEKSPRPLSAEPRAEAQQRRNRTV